MPGIDKAELLARVRLFAGLTKRDLNHVARRADVIQVSAGSEIVREDTPGHELYLIASGQAAVRRRGRRVASLGAGEYFGELAILDGGIRTATVVAETDLQLLVLGQREVFAVLDDKPAVAIKLLTAMAHRLREADVKATTS